MVQIPLHYANSMQHWMMRKTRNTRADIAVESEVKEALTGGLRALVHHLITSASCLAAVFSRCCVFSLLLLPKVDCLPVHTTLHINAIRVSSQQTDSVICMQIFSLC